MERTGRLVAGDVHALARIPVSAGPVAAAVDDAFDGLDAEAVVAYGSVLRDHGRGAADADAGAPGADDVVVADQGAFGHRVDGDPTRAHVPHLVATNHVAHRLSAAADDRDQDPAAATEHAVAAEDVALALGDDPALRVTTHPVSSDLIVVRLLHEYPEVAVAPQSIPFDQVVMRAVQGDPALVQLTAVGARRIRYQPVARRPEENDAGARVSRHGEVDDAVVACAHDERAEGEFAHRAVPKRDPIVAVVEQPEVAELGFRTARELGAVAADRV